MVTPLNYAELTVTLLSVIVRAADSSLVSSETPSLPTIEGISTQLASADEFMKYSLATLESCTVPTTNYSD